MGRPRKEPIDPSIAPQHMAEMGEVMHPVVGAQAPSADPIGGVDVRTAEGRVQMREMIGNRSPTIITLLDLVDQGVIDRDAQYRPLKKARDAWGEWWDWIKDKWADEDVESLKACQGFEDVDKFFRGV